MTDRSHIVFRLKENLLEECADIMLTALREQAGVLLGSDESYRAKEKIMDALRGIITI